MPTPVHKIGATFAFSGPVTFGGADADLSGWTFDAAILGNGFRAAITCTGTVIDGKTTVTVFAAPESQAAWRAGEAWLEVRLKSPNGTVFATSSALLILERSINE
ncbi:MAG: hypothetical protein LBE22_07625 [Azoarcus sp.]|jgi:hypothetical protein|nr:hypothetical protein [Azoarcus sp.]